MHDLAIDLLEHKWPLNNDHLSTTATIFGSQRWSLNTGLTVQLNFTSNEIWPRQIFRAKDVDQDINPSPK